MIARFTLDREIHACSRMLMHVAWIALVAHVAIFAVQLWKPAHALAWSHAIRMLEVAGMGVVFLALRGPQWYPPRGAAARQLWSIWLGYLAGCGVLYVVDFLQTPPNEAPTSLGVYPSMAVLASLVFVMLGSSYWGYCYVIGGLFLVLAVIMTFWLPAAPLVFGICWATSLLLLGVRLGRLAKMG